MNKYNLQVGDKLGIDVIDKVTDVGIYFKRKNYLFKFDELEYHIKENLNNPKSTFYLIKGNKVKEIIGYKLKDKKYKDAALAVIQEDSFRNDPGIDISQSYNIQKYRELEVLDLWFEPVYKPTEVVVNLSNNRTATITSNTMSVITLTDSTKFLAPSEDIAKVLTALNGLASIAGYKPKFTTFELGCQTFTIDDLVAVNQAFINFK